MKKRILAGAVAVMLLLSMLIINAGAASEADENMIAALNSKYAVVTCAENSQVVLSKNAQTKIAPAASAKLMTALLVAEYMADTGKDPASTTFLIPREATGFAGVANINLITDEELTIQELLTALLVSNANDACVALAIYVSGTEAAFVEKMNAKAKALGARNTTYVNSTGQDETINGETTAYDTSLILTAFYKHNELVEMTKILRYELRATNKSSSRAMNNKNHLISQTLISKYYNKDAIGLMYTYSAEAGHCLFTAVQKDELTFLIVLMGAEQRAVSAEDNSFIMCFSDAGSLFSWCSGFGYQTLISASTLLGQMPVYMSGSSEAVSYHPKDTIEFLVKTEEFDKEKISLLIELDFDEEVGLEAPVTKDDVVGTVEVLYDGEKMGKTDIVLTASVERSQILYIWSRVEAVLFSSGMKTAAIAFVVLVVLYILLMITLQILRLVKKAKRRKARKLQAQSGKRRVYYYVDEDDDDFDEDDEFYE